MPRGRPRLDPEVKLQNLAEARKQYETKNVESRREAAKLQMQRKRTEIAASDNSTRLKYLGQAARNSEWYRDRKRVQEREERRTTNAVIKKARGAGESRAAQKAPAPTQAAAITTCYQTSPEIGATTRRKAVALAPNYQSEHADPCTSPPCTSPPASNAHKNVGEQDNAFMDEESDEEHTSRPP
ncbi:hypothetical protein MVEN_00125700 [Mycena venus]|uniref:Uncharacterized protein n=1 Tax=Mycena venus TaxID=2733690 RepID=A0A8H7DIJ9_9AGAR|nr:hypothetical protein MVEN_00125700 [Mycena venus]